MEAEPSVSSKLSEAITFLRNCEKGHKYYYAKVGEQEKLQTDLLHSIELNSSSYTTRCKIATQLRRCLLDRRYYKDRLEERAPIAAFLQESQNNNLLDGMARALGEVRKAERYHQNRFYIPRVPQPSNINADVEEA